MTVAWPRHGGQGLAVNRQQEAQSRGGAREAGPGAGVDKPADRLDLSGPEAQAPEEQVLGLYQL